MIKTSSSIFSNIKKFGIDDITCNAANSATGPSDPECGAKLINALSAIMDEAEQLEAQKLAVLGFDQENVLEEDTYVAVKKFSSYSIYVLKGC